MRLHLESATGTLRLDDEGFEALVAGVDAGLDGGTVAQVRADPAFAAALLAIDAPVVRVRVDVAGRTSTQTHLVWVDRDCAALLLIVDGDERQLVATAPQHLAAALARIVRLGPRKVGLRTPVPVADEVAEDLLHADDVRRWSALALVDAELSWTLSATWDGGERLLRVVDGATGLRLLEPTDGGFQLTPVTGTMLWRRLTTLLPGDDRLPADV